jgi:hypothetical protein
MPPHSQYSVYFYTIKPVERKSNVIASKGASAENWNYRFDHCNQLIAAGKHATAGGTLLAKVQYPVRRAGRPHRTRRGRRSEI